MLKKYATRRQFLNYGKLSLLFLLNSCANSSKRITISLQRSFYPDSLKDTFPDSWKQENISFSELNSEKNQKKLINSDFVLINDGWINSLNFKSFENINNLFPKDKLDDKSKEFLSSFKEHKSNKLFPIGIVPYVVIIKNNKDLIYDVSKSWDFLLDKKLKGKIIFPQSPRIIISIAQKITEKDSLSKLKSQVNLFDDRNSINWLINSQASVAIVPFTQCVKYLKVDSRLSFVFPNKGVPLIWNFLLSKSKINDQILTDWIKCFENRSTIDELVNQGWYLPFNNAYSQNKYNLDIESNNFGPSKMCWENSWSYNPINNKEKLNLENMWKNL